MRRHRRLARPRETAARSAFGKTRSMTPGYGWMSTECRRDRAARDVRARAPDRPRPDNRSIGKCIANRSRRAARVDTRRHTSTSRSTAARSLTAQEAMRGECPHRNNPGGASRSRTDLSGFAGRRITALLPRRELKSTSPRAPTPVANGPRDSEPLRRAPVSAKTVEPIYRIGEKPIAAQRNTEPSGEAIEFRIITHDFARNN